MADDLAVKGNLQSFNLDETRLDHQKLPLILMWTYTVGITEVSKFRTPFSPSPTSN